MTLNLTGRYYSTSRDFAVTTTDPPTWRAIEQVFGTDWDNGDSPPRRWPGFNLVWSPGAEPILGLIDSAQRTLQVENEEMDDATVTDALGGGGRAGRRRRGHDDRHIVVEGCPLQLAAGGVHVHVYSRHASLYIHAKVIVADGDTGLRGQPELLRSQPQLQPGARGDHLGPGAGRATAATLTADFDEAPAYSP